MCLSVYISVCLSVCLSICLPDVSVCLSVCLPSSLICRSDLSVLSVGAISRSIRLEPTGRWRPPARARQAGRLTEPAPSILVIDRLTNPTSMDSFNLAADARSKHSSRVVDPSSRQWTESIDSYIVQYLTTFESSRRRARRIHFYFFYYITTFG